MSELSLHVDALAGSRIDRVAEEMIALAKKLDVLIETDFNSVPILATSETTVDQVVERYHRGQDVQEVQLRRKGKIRE